MAKWAKSQRKIRGRKGLTYQRSNFCKESSSGQKTWSFGIKRENWHIYDLIRILGGHLGQIAVEKEQERCHRSDFGVCSQRFQN